MSRLEVGKRHDGIRIYNKITFDVYIPEDGKYAFEVSDSQSDIDFYLYTEHESYSGLSHRFKINKCAIEATSSDYNESDITELNKGNYVLEIVSVRGQNEEIDFLIEKLED